MKISCAAVALLACVAVLFLPSFVHAEISANHKAGAVVIGPADDAECTSATEGALRWDSSEKTHHMCDGLEWKRILASGGAGDTSTPPTNTGYFVLSAGTWNATTMGQMEGANDKCLTDLTNNNWLNKADAVSRGLLNASNVRAFLCRNSLCQNPVAGATYTFAVSGQATTGGADFTADLSSRGPGNTQNWSGTNYFGTAVDYWTGRAVGSSTSTLWSTSSSSACAGGNYWAPGGGAIAVFGSSNNSDVKRWASASLDCATSLHLVCMVHP